MRFAQPSAPWFRDLYISNKLCAISRHKQASFKTHEMLQRLLPRVYIFFKSIQRVWKCHTVRPAAVLCTGAPYGSRVKTDNLGSARDCECRNHVVAASKLHRVGFARANWTDRNLSSLLYAPAVATYVLLASKRSRPVERTNGSKGQETGLGAEFLWYFHTWLGNCLFTYIYIPDRRFIPRKHHPRDERRC